MSRNDRICEAIRENKVVEFFYDGHRRVIVPVQLGLAADNGNIILIGYQIGGYSESGEMPPWRRFETYKIRNFVVTKETRDEKIMEAGPNLKITESLC